MNIAPLLMLVAFGVVMWFLILRPARARAAAAAKVVSEIAVGDYVMTTAGMFGTIRDLDDEHVSLEVADGVVLRMLKPAIARTADRPTDASLADLQGTVQLDKSTSDVIDISQS
ncbi:MAG: preprotein translocase subunit YajC [Actinomycetes bacterium]